MLILRELNIIKVTKLNWSQVQAINKKIKKKNLVNFNVK